uniref:Uncharacterized protein n=1 Tax=Glossina pallidipes TaxID=7398 RepID=A0A1A9Z4V0_GLOPL
MPTLCNSSAGPIPDNINKCGEAKAPADNITSPIAYLCHDISCYVPNRDFVDPQIYENRVKRLRNSSQDYQRRPTDQNHDDYPIGWSGQAKLSLGNLGKQESISLFIISKDDILQYNSITYNIFRNAFVESYTHARISLRFRLDLQMRKAKALERIINTYDIYDDLNLFITSFGGRKHPSTAIHLSGIGYGSF